MSKKLLVVDSSSVAVTLFYALGGLDYLGDQEYEVEEIVDFLQTVCATTLDNITRKVELDGYDSVRMALDPPQWAPSWRYKAYKDYKYAESRPNKPRVATNLQQGLAEEAIRRGIIALFSPGYEADDIIGTMVAKSETWIANGGEVHIWSQDKDLHQLVSPGVIMLGKAGAITTYEDVVEEWKVEPNGIPLVKAFIGDSSDNIPGVRGVGPVTLQKFLRPAPHRYPSPYWIDVNRIPDSLHRDVLHQLPRVVRDEEICLISRDAELLPGSEYNNVTKDYANG